MCYTLPKRFVPSIISSPSFNCGTSIMFVALSLSSTTFIFSAICHVFFSVAHSLSFPSFIFMGPFTSILGL